MSDRSEPSAYLMDEAFGVYEGESFDAACALVYKAAYVAGMAAGVAAGRNRVVRELDALIQRARDGGDEL